VILCIVVVEDEFLIRLMIVEALADEGFEVIEAVTIGANAEQVLMTSSELSRNPETLNSGVKSFMQRARRL